MAGVDVLLVGDEVGGREAERAAAPVALDHRPLEQEGRAEAAHRALDVAGGDQRADPGRGDGLAVDLDQRHDARSRTRRGAEHLGVALRLAPKRKFSPTETRLAPEPLDQDPLQNSSASIVENSLSNGITTSSETPSPSITSRLISNGMISFGAASGWITRERMRLEGEHRVGALDHLPVADVDAVEGADRDLRGRLLGVGQGCDLDAHRRAEL